MLWAIRMILDKYKNADKGINNNNYFFDKKHENRYIIFRLYYFYIAKDSMDIVAEQVNGIENISIMHDNQMLCIMSKMIKKIHALCYIE